MSFAGLDPRFVLTGVKVTDRELGCGSYSAVLEVEYNGLKCAGKKIHKTLLEHEGSANAVARRFEEECRILSQTRHPNIVQFLGVYFQQGERIPILVMELLPIELYSCIKQHGILPKDISYSILHDVALGLHYLHSQSPPIMHRDLCSNDILLTLNMTAKIIDLSTAKLDDDRRLSTDTVCPGIPYIMPPEAMMERPRYNTSIDVFSFGILLIHMFSGQLPEPKAAVYTEPDGRLIGLSEAERRSMYFQAIGDDHPAMELILNCINNDPQQRPTTNDILQQLKSISQNFVPSLEERLDSCKKALEEKETVDQIIMQGVFVGFPRSGKTSTKKRLMGKRPSRQQASTGVAEKASRVEIEKTTVQSLSSADWHEIDDLDEETAVITDDIDSFESQKEKAREEFIKHMREKDDSFAARTLGVQNQETHQTASSYSEFNPATISVYLKDVEMAIRKFERKYHTRMKPWTIYLKDTGGQPEFQELLPALVAGPSLYFLFFRLDQDLNSKYLVQYQHPTSGRLIEPFEASFTMKEALLQFLASIASTRSYTKIEDRTPVTPKVLFIGTHKDNLKPDQQLLVARIDQDLQQAVCKTEAFQEGMIEFATKDNLILAIDNFSESEEDVQSIRDAVERIGMRSEVYNMQTPYSWLLFSIVLRKQHKRVMSLDTCMEIAKRCRIDTLEELQSALWFLHHNTGVVRYFEEVPALKSVIIVEPQYIFDKLTELIVNTLTFEVVGKPQYDEFIKKGIFAAEMVQKLTSESDGLDGDKFTALLEYLHIVAPIEEGTKIVKYFAPCALTHAKPAPSISDLPCKIPSILLTFKSGYCPKGIFGSLVVKLLDKDKPSKFVWALEEDHIYRDQLLLSVGPFDSFRFQVTAAFIRIDLTASLDSPDRPVSLKDVCCDVCHCVEKSVKYVSKKLHYTHKAAHSLAFVCPGPHIKGMDTANAHPATINTYNGKVCSTTCTLTNKKLLLPDGYNIWFNEGAADARSSKDSNSSIEHEMPTASTQESFLNITSIPKLHELDRIEGNSKVIKVIEHVASTWDKLALRLYFSHYHISRINRDTREQSVQAAIAVFTEWLDGKGRKPTTWKTLISALRESEFITVANDLEVIFGVRNCNDIVAGSKSDSVPQPQLRSQDYKCTVL